MPGGAPGETPPAGDLRLEVLAGKAVGFTIVVDERMVIGRHSEGPGRLADDPELSRHHAEISRRSEGGFSIEDLSSTNGTYVNGTRLESPAALAVGDKIDVGTTTILVRTAPAAAAPEPGPAPGSEPIDVRAATVTVDLPPAMRAPEPPAPEAIPAPVGAAMSAPEAPAAPEPEPEAHTDPLPEPVVIEPANDALEPAEPAPAPLELRIVVDLEHAEAQIALDGGGEAMRMRFEDGRWRLAPGGE